MLCKKYLTALLDVFVSLFGITQLSSSKITSFFQILHTYDIFENMTGTLTL